MLTITLPMQFIVELKREKKPIKIRLWHINSNIRKLNNIVQNIIIDLASCIAGYEKSKEVKNVNEMLHDVTQYRELFDVSGFLDKNIKIIILKYMTIILKKKLHKNKIPKNIRKNIKKYIEMIFWKYIQTSNFN